MSDRGEHFGLEIEFVESVPSACNGGELILQITPVE
jgi:hypothetical protein